MLRPIPHLIPIVHSFVVMRYLATFIFLTSSGGFSTKAEANSEIGTPFIQHFSPSDMGAHHQNWGIAFTDDGDLVVSNQLGVSLFDGANWHTLSEPHLWNVNSLAVDGDRIYLGAQNDFGYFEKSLLNRLAIKKADPIENVVWQYTSLVKKFQLAGVNQIYSTAHTPYGNFFVDEKTIYRFHDDKIIEVNLDKVDSVGRLKWVNGQLYVLGYLGKLWYYNLNTNQLVLIAKDLAEDNTYIRDILPLANQRLLLLTFDRGLFEVSANGEVKSVTTEIDAWLGQSQAWKFIYTPKPPRGTGTPAIIIASKGDGIAMINPYGKLLRSIRTDDGLKYNSVKGLAFDNELGLWLAQDGGVSRVDLLSPISAFTGVRGVQGVQTIKAFRQRMLVGSRLSGIHIYEPSTKAGSSGHFRYLDPKYKAVWDFAVVEDGVIVSDRRGMDWLILDDQYQVKEKVYLGRHRGLAFVKSTSSRFYATTFDGLLRLDKQNERWTADKVKKQSLRAFLQYLVMDKHGDLWAGGIYNKVARISKLSQWPNFEVEWFNHQQGLPQGPINVFNAEGQLYFSTQVGLFTWSESAKQFNPIYKQGDLGFMRELVLHNGAWWIINKGQLMRFTGQDEPAQAIYLPGIDKIDLSALYSSPDGTLWLAKLDGLYRMESAGLIAPAQQSAKARLKLSQLIEKSSNQAYITNQFDRTVVVSPNHETLTLNFATSSFNNIANNRYRVRLNNETWSDLIKEGTWQARYLPYGKHRIEVQASNGPDFSDIHAINLAVIKPWYLSTYLLIVYSIGALVIVLFANKGYVRYKTNKLKIEALQLNEKINTATATIHTQKNRLEKLDAYKTQFFANVTHELRTPLTVALGTLELIKNKDTISDQTRQQLESIWLNNQRLLAMVNQILEVNRLHDVKELASVKGEVHDLVKLTKKTLLSFQGLAEKEKLQLAFGGDSAPVNVLMNTEQVEQIITNLVFNALKFTPPWGRIDVSVHAIGAEAKMQISDTGIGIDAKDKPYIFDRFFTHPADIKYGFQQTGIGLSLVKSLMAIHGGRIDVNDNEPSGTCFDLFFPLAPSSAKVRDKDPTKETKRAPSPNVFLEPAQPATIEEDTEWEGDSRRKILVIDDNQEIGELISALFSPDYRVLSALDGEAGLALAKAELPDLILCDLRMPKLDGLGVTRAIKSDEELAMIPLIMLTASHSKEDELKSLTLEANDFISKPFDTAKLHQKVINQIALQTRWREHYQSTNKVKSNDESSNEVSIKKKQNQPEPAPWLIELEQRLSEKLSEVKTIKDLANLAHMDRSNLYRKLQATLALSPQQFLRNHRLQAAKTALKTTDNSISAIANHCGFGNLSSFSRAFKDQYGISPNQYRAQNKT